MGCTMKIASSYGVHYKRSSCFPGAVEQVPSYRYNLLLHVAYCNFRAPHDVGEVWVLSVYRNYLIGTFTVWHYELALKVITL